MTNPTLLQHFRSFCAQNRPQDMEKAIEYFAVFGGLGWEIDMQQPLGALIEAQILDNYNHLHREVRELSSGESSYHALLSGIALGDGRVHSALKRSALSEEEGKKAISFLVQSGIIRRESANVKSRKWMDTHTVSDKLVFNTPFMRFWFAFVSPLFKGIKEGNYEEVRERFANRRQELFEGTFKNLSLELFRKSFDEDPLVEAAHYWDNDVEIDLLGKTASGRIVAGSCKYSTAKAKKSELAKLKESCAAIRIEPDICVLISKEGFSSELKALKGESLRLFSAKNFKKLLDDLSASEILKGLPKPYRKG